ncbi:MAG: hypothetical protein RLZZ502_1256 [Pseudomonadota bacterium]|jgi:iron(III) transport system ATP-binding protein
MAESLRFEHITKDYGTGEAAVKDISFTIKAGQLLTLLGPSGCGKTTTLRMIAGLELPSSGRIFLGEQEVSRQSAAERNVSLVFQSYALFPHMTVMQNVGYGLTVQGKKGEAVTSKVNEILKLIGLDGYEQRLPAELSGGQQQRVAIARALVLEPAVLLFDEPLSNLDARLRRHVREEIRALQQRLGITCVYVTHDREEALAVSDEIIVMNKGEIAEQGAAQDLFYRPQTAFVADFLSEANVLAASTLGLEAHDGKRCAIRPDCFRLAAGAGDRPLKAELITAAFIGRGLECTVKINEAEVFVFLAGCTEVPPPHFDLYYNSADVRWVM